MKALLSLVIFGLLLTLLVGINLRPAQATHEGSDRGMALDEARQLAFYASGNGNVTLVDVSDPAHITLVSDAIHTGGAVEDLFYDTTTQRLYIAADAGGLEIWDVATPTSPMRLSSTPIFYGGVEAPARGIAVKGDYAYVSADWGYLHWLNVADPTNPVDEGANGYGGNPSRDLHLSADGYLFLAGPDTVRYRINDDGSLTVWGANQYAQSYEIFGADGYIYIDSGVHTMDILDANASGFPFISNYALANIEDIFVVGDYAYIANGVDGFRILDVSDKENVTEAALDDSDGGSALYVASGRAYVQVASRLRVFDVTTPTSPFVLGAFDISGPACWGQQSDVAELTIAPLGQAVQIAWADTGASQYKVYRAVNDPYFMPYDATNLIATISSTTYTDTHALFDPLTNFSYKVRGVDSCVPASGYVERVGEFDFSLMPGTN